MASSHRVAAENAAALILDNLGVKSPRGADRGADDERQPHGEATFIAIPRALR